VSEKQHGSFRETGSAASLGTSTSRVSEKDESKTKSARLPTWRGLACNVLRHTHTGSLWARGTFRFVFYFSRMAAAFAVLDDSLISDSYSAVESRRH